MFYNLAGSNATYFEERINVLIALCPFWILGEQAFFNKVLSYIAWVFEPLFNPTFKFYRMNPADTLHHIAMGYGCGYYPFKYVCDYGVSGMATSTHEYTDIER